MLILTKNCKANKSFIWRSFLGIAILETQVWVESQLCSEGQRKGQSLLKQKKGGSQRDYINYFERVVADAGKQTYTILSVINC